MLSDLGQAPECSVEQHKQLISFVRKGKIFELMDWVKEGRPTLIPYEKNVRRSLITEAARIGNHSMVVFLWEHALQRQWELDSLITYSLWENRPASAEIALYLMEQGLPMKGVTAYDVFPTHNEALIRLAMQRGLGKVWPRKDELYPL